MTKEILIISDGLDSCNFEFTRLKDFPVTSTAWMYPKSSILKTLFDKDFIQSGEQGISVRNKRQQEKESCNSTKLIEVNFCFTTLFFGILFIGTIASIIGLAMEVVWSAYV